MKKTSSNFSVLRSRPLSKWLRGAASYLALAGAFASTAWLSAKMENLPSVNLGPWDLEKIPLVVVDAGHGGHDGGAVAGGTLEKKLALALALRLRDELITLGLRVKMTRDSDVFLPLEERAALADEWQADAFISVHLNTSASPEVHGIETYYNERKSLAAQRALQVKWSLAKGPVQDLRGRRLAESLQRHACRGTEAVDRGIKQRNYAVVSQTQVPAALIECGFLTHEAEAASLKNPDYQKKLTLAIARGMAEFLKIQGRYPPHGVLLDSQEPTEETPETAAP